LRDGVRTDTYLPIGRLVRSGMVSSDEIEGAVPNARTERRQECAGGRARTASTCVPGGPAGADAVASG
jgi:hypothetical protein